jgi:hypothetical protein
VIGVWEDTATENQLCGNQNNPQHCVLWKPPDYTPISFDNFGGVANCGSVDGVVWPYINGLGQISGTATNGQEIDITFGTGSIFIDDVQNGTPSLADSQNGNAAMVIPASSSDSYYSNGINNNGQIAGNVQTGAWVNLGCCKLEWIESGEAGLFINNDGTAVSLQNENVCGDVVSLNDDVQLMLDESCTVDTQH